MESEKNPSFFWLGIESEGGVAEWEALVRQRLEAGRMQSPPLLIVERVVPAAAQPVIRQNVRAA